MINCGQAGGDPNRLKPIQRTAQSGLSQEFFKVKASEMQKPYYQEKRWKQTGDEVSSEELTKHEIHTAHCTRGLQQSTAESSNGS